MNASSAGTLSRFETPNGRGDRGPRPRSCGNPAVAVYKALASIALAAQVYEAAKAGRLDVVLRQSITIETGGPGVTIGWTEARLTLPSRATLCLCRNSP